MLSTGLSAQEGDQDTLQPFDATFRITVSKIPTPVTARLVLRPLEEYPDHYQMLFRIDSWLLKNTEESVFAWRDCQPRTDHYRHEFQGFGKHRYHNMQFYRHPEPHVRVESEKEKTRYDIQKDTRDEMTLLLTAGCALEEGAREYRATSAYGDELREHHFRVIDEEVIDTPLGKLDTLVVEKQRDEDSERRTLFWVAPALDYMVVRAKHIENPALFGELIMIDYSGPGKLPEQSSEDDDLKRAAK